MDSFNVFLNEELQLVKVVVEGELFQNDGEKVITAARTLAAEHNYNILYDMRAATSTIEFSSWFRLPRDLDVFQETNARKIKAAVIVSQTDKALEGYKFYETVMDNLGFKTRIFFDETEALIWISPKS
jgi:hypothetical protein